MKELQETREAYEKILQKDREFYENKIQEIGKLHHNILDENREYHEETMRRWEQRDLAVAQSLTKLSSISDLARKSTTEYHILDSLSDMGMTARYKRSRMLMHRRLNGYFRTILVIRVRTWDILLSSGLVRGPVSSGSQGRQVLANLR